MPVLDAKALSSDPQGLAFLRDVLRPASEPASDKPRMPRETLLRLCQTKATPLKAPAERTPARIVADLAR